MWVVRVSCVCDTAQVAETGRTAKARWGVDDTAVGEDGGGQIFPWLTGVKIALCVAERCD